MTRNLLLAGVALLALVSAQPGFAQSASDDATRDLIERLRPTEQQTRGIRMPGTDTGTAAPVLVPAVPDPAPSGALAPALAPAPAPPRAPAPATASPPLIFAPPQAPSPAAGTTAPSGMAAVSITVNFATGSAALSPQAAAALTALGRALASPDLRPFRFRIEGHTDTEGDAALNMALSQRRAEAVRDFLLKGFPIAPFRLVAVGFGESQLLVPTPDNSPEARNRRVQVVNLGG